MNRDNEEEFVEEPTEDQVETLTKKEYLCTACFDVFGVEELNGDLNNCPTCKETDCITES